MRKRPAAEEASASAGGERRKRPFGVHRVAGAALPPPARRRVGSCAFVWVGSGESPALTRALAVLHGRCAGVAQFDPATSRLARGGGRDNGDRARGQAPALPHRAREGVRVIGIVAGTLGVAGYLTAIARVRG